MWPPKRWTSLFCYWCRENNYKLATSSKKKIIGFIGCAFTITRYSVILACFINTEIYFLKRHNHLFCRLISGHACDPPIIGQDREGPATMQMLSIIIGPIAFLKRERLIGLISGLITAQDLIILHQNRNDTP
jgi:hypothetical protein